MFWHLRALKWMKKLTYGCSFKLNSFVQSHLQVLMCTLSTSICEFFVVFEMWKVFLLVCTYGILWMRSIICAIYLWIVSHRLDLDWMNKRSIKKSFSTQRSCDSLLILHAKFFPAADLQTPRNSWQRPNAKIKNIKRSTHFYVCKQMETTKCKSNVTHVPKLHPQTWSASWLPNKLTNREPLHDANHPISPDLSGLILIICLKPYQKNIWCGRNIIY